MNLLNADGTPMVVEDNTKQVDEFHDSEYSATWDHELGRPTVIKGTQEITPATLDDLRDLRVDGGNKREGEMMKIASIPVVVVDKWMREGFDVFKHSAKDIVKKLKQEDLGHFMATNKNI